MRWWCSAGAGAWSWSWQPYAGVWLLLALLAIAYWRLRRSAIDGTQEPRPATGLLDFGLGWLMLWLALDWPLAALGAGYLASAHMVQYLLLSLVIPPLLLRAVPVQAYERLRDRPRLLRALKGATHPGVALATFAAVMVISHVPTVVDTLMVSQPGSFVLDMAWLLAGLVFWWPLVSPLPARPGFTAPLRMGYLLAISVPGTAVGMFLVFADYPQYAIYELAAPVPGWALSSLIDQRLAGLLMKFGMGLVMWTLVTVMFFRWYRETELEEGSGGGTRSEPSHVGPAGV